MATLTQHLFDLDREYQQALSNLQGALAHLRTLSAFTCDDDFIYVELNTEHMVDHMKGLKVREYTPTRI